VDYKLNVALGNVTGVSLVNKFGRVNDNLDLGVTTDIWDGANSGIGTLIWVAPTQARIHAITSTSTADDEGSTGAYSVTIFGLTSWDADEVSETVILDGTNNVNTVNSYVIIHRMFVNAGANTTDININTGQISATAATDGTVTAYIMAGQAQTEMAVYGVPSTQNLIITDFRASVYRATTAAINYRFRYNPNPDVQLTGFRDLGGLAVNSAGTTTLTTDINYVKIPGPAIIKVQGISSANNADGSARFAGYLVRK